MDARAAVVAEAGEWLGTPFHHQGRVKGAGVDCAMLLAEVYERCGLVRHVDPGYYPPDWHLHRDAERYLEKLMPYAHELAGPPALGDVAVFRYGLHLLARRDRDRLAQGLIHAYWQRRVWCGAMRRCSLAGQRR